MHSPNGEKRGGADAASLLAPLVMLVVRREETKVRKKGEKYDYYSTRPSLRKRCFGTTYQLEDIGFSSWKTP